MSELKDRIYGILKNVQLSTLATITPDGKPWVRYVMTAASHKPEVWTANP